MQEPTTSTQAAAYTQRLNELERAPWKRWLSVQAPYRWHLKRLRLGFTLDIGCGIGRNLLHLDGHGVGIDHNPHSLQLARERGCLVMLPEEFMASDFGKGQAFDSILVSHVLEHMPLAEAGELLRGYLPRLRAGGRLVLITPQEAGQASDETHVEFMDSARLADLMGQLDLYLVANYSQPLPRFCGRVFRHNEFVAIGRKQA